MGCHVNAASLWEEGASQMLKVSKNEGRGIADKKEQW